MAAVALDTEAGKEFVAMEVVRCSLTQKTEEVNNWEMVPQATSFSVKLRDCTGLSTFP